MSSKHLLDSSHPMVHATPIATYRNEAVDTAIEQQLQVVPSQMVPLSGGHKDLKELQERYP